MTPNFLATVLAAQLAGPESASAWAANGAVVLLAVATLAAVQARSVRGARRHRLQELCREFNDPCRYDEIIDSAETVAFIAASVVAAATAGATLLAGRWLLFAGEPLAVRLAAAGGWLAAVWLLLVVLPMVVTRLAGPSVVVRSWRAWRPVVAAANPLVAGVGRLAGWIGRLIGYREEQPSEEDMQDELRLVVDEAHREGRLAATARDMIEGVIDLDDVKVSQVMTNRTEMVTLPVNHGFEATVRDAAESGHSRIPIWENSPDNIVGLLHTRELLVALADRERQHEIRDLLRPPTFVPESKSVQNLLKEFQQTRTHLAVVTNEFGGIAGLVTIEDVLEEIVGEIDDEHDEEATDGMRLLGGGIVEARARVRLEEVNERLGLQLPEEEDYETIGGLVFHLAGRIPSVGERFETDGVCLTVLGATRRRIDWVRIEPIHPPPAE
jgi:CBS domain containing-hemolysin-like protein